MQLPSVVWGARLGFISIRASPGHTFSATLSNFIFNPAKGRLNGSMNGKMQEALKQMVGCAGSVTCQALDCVAI